MENLRLQRQIRAVYDEKTIRVYQAYSNEIADAALDAGRLVPPFKKKRMTWIKPSFLWMMYRCGWATKFQQERVLAIDIKRTGFEWALAHSCLSQYEFAKVCSLEEWEQLKERNPVRVQWDPERGFNLERLDYKSIQIGLSGEAVDHYVNEWIVKIDDITSVVAQLAANPNPDYTLLPMEGIYPVPINIAHRIAVQRG